MLKRLVVLMTLCLAAACGSDGDDDATSDGGATVDARIDGNMMHDGQGMIPDGAASGAFASACTGTGQGTCNTGLICFPFNADGPHCTKSCTSATAATDCAPSTFGCSGMNVCKIRP